MGCVSSKKKEKKESTTVNNIDSPNNQKGDEKE